MYLLIEQFIGINKYIKFGQLKKYNLLLPTVATNPFYLLIGTLLGMSII